MSVTPPQLESPWPHRLAVVTVLATFCLLSVGGLVTTLKAGMAVEDWPNTFGYPLFFYPILDWLRGPRDVFVEHGHRLLGQLVGLLSITLAVVTWRSESRRWVRWLAVATVPAVTFQGILGGMRVLQNDVLLARIHGCVGPLVFALFVTIAAVTSNRWRSTVPRPYEHSERLKRLAFFTTAIAYLQLVAGAHLRHVPATTTPATFRIVVLFHLFLGLVLAAHVLILAARAWKFRRMAARVTSPANVLALLVLAQLGLGVLTWSLKYGWPTWLGAPPLAGEFTVTQGAPAQSLVTTLHVAVGWLILVIALTVLLRASRGLCHPNSFVGQTLLRANSVGNSADRNVPAIYQSRRFASEAAR
jgi:cytochrome c oxidase assembly protein subunit 15